MASIWDRETYKKIFRKYPDERGEVLDAIENVDGVWEVPSLPEELPVVEWKTEWRFRYGGNYATGSYYIVDTTGT